MDVGFASVFMIILLDFVIVATVWYFFLYFTVLCKVWNFKMGRKVWRYQREV